MNRFHIISLILHGILFISLIIVGHKGTPPMPQFEVVKVSIAPLPQPKVISIDEPEIAEIPEKIVTNEEKARQASIKKNLSRKNRPSHQRTRKILRRDCRISNQQYIRGAVGVSLIRTISISCLRRSTRIGIILLRERMWF